MDIQQLEALGFTSFQSDDITLHAKEFPAIGYTLCTSDNGTFSLSNYPDGDILARLPIAHIIGINNRLQQADIATVEFKKLIDSELAKLFNHKKAGDNE